MTVVDIRIMFPFKKEKHTRIELGNNLPWRINFFEINQKKSFERSLGFLIYLYIENN